MSYVLPYALGLLLGIFAGLVPGIHSNTCAQLIASFLEGEPLGITIMLTVGIYAVLSFFPAIFLGVPDDNTAVSILPGHRLVKQNRGFLAIRAICISAAMAIAITLLLLPVAFAYYGDIYRLISPYLPVILVLALIALVMSEKELKRIAMAVAIILAAGLLGFLSLNLPIKQPLFPLFVGLFAIPSLLHSASIITARDDKKAVSIPFNVILLGVVCGFAADLLPGIASGAQMAVFASPLFQITEINFLIFVSSLAVSTILFAIPSRIETGKDRIGAFTFVNDIETKPIEYLFLLVIGMFIGLLVLAFILKNMHKLNINLKKINKTIVAYLCLMTFLISGLPGLALLLSASILGTIVLRTEIKRVHLMGSIIVPTIILLA